MLAIHLSQNNDEKKAIIQIQNKNKQIQEERCHLDTNEKHLSNQVWQKLLVVTVLAFIFMIIEMIGGFIAHSVSIQTNAAHMASDITGFFFNIISIYVPGKCNFNKIKSFLNFGKEGGSLKCMRSQKTTLFS